MNMHLCLTDPLESDQVFEAVDQLALYSVHWLEYFLG